MLASGRAWSSEELAHALWLDLAHVTKALAQLTVDGKVVPQSLQQFDRPSVVRYQVAVRPDPLGSRKPATGAARARSRFLGRRRR